MIIQVNTTDIDKGNHLARYIESKVGRGLRRHRHHIQQVEVYIRDVNADKGGEDIECKVIIRSTLNKDVIISERKDDAGMAFRHAFRRAVYNFREGLNRRQPRSAAIVSGRGGVAWT